MTDDPEPERYYDWMLWKSRQDEKMAEEQLKLDLNDGWDEEKSNRRIDIIGQNGNDGLHYDEVDSDAKIYESPDKVKTVYERNLHAPHSERKRIKSEGWDNHEDSFEETLRREMLKWKEMYFILQEDHKRLTEDYYTVLKRVKELTEGK